jgi:elongation factor P
MGVINTSELKNGIKVLFEGQPYTCLAVDFVKPGKGAAFYKCRVQNLLTGNVLEKTIRSGEKIDTADVVETDMEYLYPEGDGFVFMDSVSFDQLSVSKAAVGDMKDFLTENTVCVVTLWDGQPIAVRLPNQMTFEVTYTEPAVKGDTQARVMKDATLNTGAVVSVPTFVDIGEKIIVDTRTRAYISRVSK